MVALYDKDDQDVTKDFGIMADSMFSVIRVGMIDEGSIRLEYYRVKKEIVSEILDIF